MREIVQLKTSESADHQRRRIDDGDVERQAVERDAVQSPCDQGQLPATSGARKRLTVDHGRSAESFSHMVDPPRIRHPVSAQSEVSRHR